LDELLDALSGSSDSAVGPDDIRYQMLKHLPSEALYTLINTLNDIWITGNFPSTWHNSYVVPVAKIQQTLPVTVPLLLEAVFVK